jgi:hypothetical protein
MRGMLIFATAATLSAATRRLRRPFDAVDTDPFGVLRIWCRPHDDGRSGSRQRQSERINQLPGHRTGDGPPSRPVNDMTLGCRARFALPLALLIVAAADAAPKRHTTDNSGWDGRWVGSWNGSRPTAQIVRGGKLIAYEYNGQTYPVATSHVTPTKIVYGEVVVVTLTRTGANTAHATIKTMQGEGTAELTRQ